MADKTSEDLTRLKLPKGGVATFWKADDLPTRRSIQLEESSLTIPKAPTRAYLAALAEAKKTHPGLSDDELVKQGHVSLPEYTPEEARLQSQHGLLTAVLYLKSWTRDAKLPETVDELLDLPRGDFEAIRQHVRKIQQADKSNTTEFTDASVEDPESPTTL